MMVKKCLIGIFILAVGYAIYAELPYFYNTFFIRFLFFRGLFVGIFVGYFVAWFYVWKKPLSLIEKLSIFKSFIYPFAIFFALGAVWSNHFWCEKSLKKTVVFLEETTSPPSMMNHQLPYTIRFRYNGNVFKIHTNYTFFQNLAKGTDIELSFRKGFWGYEFVEF